MKLYKERFILTSQFDVRKLQKQISKCNTDSIGPVLQLWSVTLKCMRGSMPQRCVQQHKSLKVTRIATLRDEHINETSKQIFANKLFIISCKYKQDML